MTKFKIRTRPVLPKRRKIKHSIDVEYDSVQTVLDKISAISPTILMKDVSLDMEYGYYDECTVVAVWEDWESEKDFKSRLFTYESTLDRYLAWEEENSEVIQEELARRIAESEKQAKIDAKKKLARLEKEAKACKLILGELQ